MKEKLKNLSAGIQELESMISTARQEGRSTAGNEVLLDQLYMMKCELIAKMEAEQHPEEEYAMVW